MNITAIIYDADARRTAYILGTVIGNCKLFPAERAPRDWSGYANVITVAAGEDGPVVTAGLQKRVTFRPKGEDETVAAAELIAKAFCPPEAPMALAAAVKTAGSVPSPVKAAMPLSAQALTRMLLYSRSVYFSP